MWQEIFVTDTLLGEREKKKMSFVIQAGGWHWGDLS